MSKQTERDAFRSRWGFILACIGSAVGMGNIWRFPYLVSAWGGMTFLLPYFLFVLLIGSTGIIGEMALGRSTRSGPIGAFGQAAALRGRRSTGEAVGYIPVLGSLALAIGYSCVVGWIFKYFALALDGGLFAMGQDMNVIVDRFNGTACGWGNNFWLVIALAVNFAIMAFGVGGGIERANKVMMPVLFFLFAGLGVYIATLPGAGDGYRYIFTLDPVGLADPKLWIYAFGQAFFSLSVAGNGTVVSLCIQAIVSDWMDVVSIYICPLGALLAGILFFWVAGKDFVLAAVNKGAGKPIGAWFYPLSKYVYCACALLALIAGALLGGIG